MRKPFHSLLAPSALAHFGRRRCLRVRVRQRYGYSTILLHGVFVILGTLDFVLWYMGLRPNISPLCQIFSSSANVHTWRSLLWNNGCRICKILKGLSQLLKLGTLRFALRS